MLRKSLGKRYAFWYLPKNVTYTKILEHVRDHVRQFYGDCWTLKPFTCNNTTFQYIFILDKRLKLDRELNDWLTLQAFITDTPFQMYPYGSYFYAILYFQQEEKKFWLIHCKEYGLFFKAFQNLQDVPHFDSITIWNTFLGNFFLFFWLATLVFTFPAVCFGVFKSSALVFCRNSSFGFCQVNLNLVFI